MSRVVINRVRREFYLDSVALMRLSKTVSELAGVESASIMIGSPSNKSVLRDAGLLNDDGDAAGANDLIIALLASGEAAAASALEQVNTLLDRPVASAAQGDAWRPKTLDAAIQTLDGVNLALISVPGAFAASEARAALTRGLNVMIFSDNVSLEDEFELKREARERGLLLMGPDCGTALIGGAPLAFANAVPRGEVGIVAASGTGLQEVSSLIARAGKGISHGIGVGGRDLNDAVGGITTLMAIDALDADRQTRHIILISKPPGEAVMNAICKRIAKSNKPFSVCFLGIKEMDLPANAVFTPTLEAAALNVLGVGSIDAGFSIERAATQAASHLDKERRWIRGLYSGGTLCAEAQVILQGAGETVHSNAPVPDASRLNDGGHVLIDLGADEYTVGRPHPMIEPAVRTDVLRKSLTEPELTVILLDVVIGYGAHRDPAGEIVAALGSAPKERAAVVASVCGTDGDPQGYSKQVQSLEDAGVIVAPSNAQAARLAVAILRGSI